MIERITRSLIKVLDYGRYGAQALAAGVPLLRVPALRRAANVIPALSRMDVTTQLRIVDVGAHRGDWSQACARAFPRSRILSFEPVSVYYLAAARRAERYANWKVRKLALGSERGVHRITVQGQRSSLKHLAGSQFHEWAKENPAPDGSEMVEVMPLDAVLQEETFFPLDLLKIDAEGYEREILQGAAQTLQHTKQVLIEVRFEELFAGAPLFADLHDMLRDHGFWLMHLKPCAGQCLWADATYARVA